MKHDAPRGWASRRVQTVSEVSIQRLRRSKREIIAARAKAAGSGIGASTSMYWRPGTAS